jgi:hypothetical protein
LAKELILSKGKVALVDDDLYPALSFFKWHYSESRPEKPGYAVHRVKVSGHWLNLKLHRFIMSAGERDIVDHIDGDTLNNQRANLRIVNHSLNSQNSIKQVGSSGYRGVSWSGRKKVWEVCIQKDDQRIFIGQFSNVDDAARAYDKKALELFGCDAMTNAKLLERKMKRLQNEK